MNDLTHSCNQITKKGCWKCRCVCLHAVLMAWLGLRHRNPLVRVRKRAIFSLLGSVVTNAARKHPEVLQKASNSLSIVHCFHLLKCDFVLFLVIYHCKLIFYVFGLFV